MPKLRNVTAIPRSALVALVDELAEIIQSYSA
jgi:hypothetical protein